MVRACGVRNITLSSYVDAIVREHLERYRTPVSYTHLDVYKRQENISLAIFKDDQLAEHIVQHDHQYIGKDLHGKAPQCLRCV